MQSLGDTVKDMGARMDGTFAEEDQKRQHENLVLKTEIRDGAQLLNKETCTRMDEGLTKEENARQLVHNDSMTIKGKIRQLDLGSCSGSTVGSDASTPVGKEPSGTFARPPPGIGVRFNDFFLPRKMEFKRWVTEYKQSCHQGLTETDVSNFNKDMRRMVPDQYRKFFGWDQTMTEQGTCPTKTMVNMWFSNDTNLPTREWGCWTSSKRNSRRSPTGYVGK